MYHLISLPNNEQLEKERRMTDACVSDYNSSGLAPCSLETEGSCCSPQWQCQATMHPKCVPVQLIKLWIAQVTGSVAKNHVVRVEGATTNRGLPRGK